MKNELADFMIILNLFSFAFKHLYLHSCLILLRIGEHFFMDEGHIGIPWNHDLHEASLCLQPKTQ